MGSNAHTEDPLYPDDLNSHSHHEQSTLLDSEHIHYPLSHREEDEDHTREVSSWKRLPWWKRPSPYWLIFGISLGSIGYAALLAPKVAMYTALACRVHRPEIVLNHHSFTSPSILYLDAPIPYVPDTSETTANKGSTLLPGSVYTVSSGYTQNGTDPDRQCASDPVVQAIVARLNAVFTTSMGVLSCLTTGWWGSISDRYGRRIVIFVSVFGLFVTDAAHVITAWFVDVLPGGYWFPLVGFLIEGLCGSMPTGVAINHAYLADTTDPSTRSRYFSLSLGLMFTGVAVGPALGGLLIRSTGTTLSVFYFASILHGIYTMLILFILPESLTRARSRGARLRRRNGLANQASSGRAPGVLKVITGFVSPFVVLLPEKILDANTHKKRRDWNLFLIAIAYGLATSIISSYSYKLQYAAAQFHWTPEIVSYYVSLVGGTRALFLAVILPFLIKYLKPTPAPSAAGEPLRDSATQANVSGQRSLTSRSPAFDLALARVSAGLEAATYLGMAVSSTGTLFTLASITGSFTAGFSPAVQALALDIYTNRRSQDRSEVGKLFGALSVTQALGSQIVSPALYGFVYFNTVAVFPQAIMIVSMCTFLPALILLLFVRIPSKAAGDRVAPEHGNEEGGQDMVTPGILLAMENEAVE